MLSTSRQLPTPRQAVLGCVLAALSVVMCAGLFGAAALAPAPHIVLPFVIGVCIGGPMLAAWELPRAIVVLRAARLASADAGPAEPLEPWAIDELLERLEELPETEHPLGL